MAKNAEIKQPEPNARMGFRASNTQLLICAVVVNLFSISLAFFAMHIVDKFSLTGDKLTLPWVVLVTVFFLGLRAFLQYSYNYVFYWSKASAHHNLLSADFTKNHLLKTQLDEFEKSKFNLWGVLISMVGIGIVFYFSSVLFIVLALAICAVLVLGSFSSDRVLLDNKKAAKEKKTTFLNSTKDALNYIRFAGLNDIVKSKFEVVQNNLSGQNLVYQNYRLKHQGIIYAVQLITIIALVKVGADQVVMQNISAGTVLAAVIICLQTFDNLNNEIIPTISKEEDAILAEPKASDYGQIPNGEIQIQNLKIDGGEVKNSVVIPEGAVVGLLSSNTSANRIFRNIIGLEHTEGANIKLGGLSASSLNEAQRKSVAYISSDGLIYKGSIMDNISGFSQDKMVQNNAVLLAKKLGFDSFIRKLKNGYNTYLNADDSDPIPPGVKQRISVVRGFANSPKIVLYDNAEKSIDKEGYNLLYKLLGKQKGRTIIISSLDKNMLSLTQKIYTIKDGVLAELKTPVSQALKSYTKEAA